MMKTYGIKQSRGRVVHVRNLFLICFAVLWLGMGLSVQAATTQSPCLRIVAAEIKGLVLYADGETPAAKVPVRIWDVETRKFIVETETNDNGLYKLPPLEPGEYFVAHDWTKVRVQVVANTGAANQQPHDIIVVIPRDVGAVSINQLSSVLFATSLTEAARTIQDSDIPPVVSP